MVAVVYGASTTYRQSQATLLDYWFCLLVGLVFAGGGTVVVLSALAAIADRTNPSYDHFGAAFGLALGLLWTALGFGSLWLAREILRTTTRLIITPAGLTHVHDGAATTFAWPEIALIHAAGARLTILPGLRDPHSIPTTDLGVNPETILTTIRHYCPTVTIAR